MDTHYEMNFYGFKSQNTGDVTMTALFNIVGFFIWGRWLENLTLGVLILILVPDCMFIDVSSSRMD